VCVAKTSYDMSIRFHLQLVVRHVVQQIAPCVARFKIHLDWTEGGVSACASHVVDATAPPIPSSLSEQTQTCTRMQTGWRRDYR
jgi:hypothetical protein